MTTRSDSIYDADGNRRCYACRVYQPPEEYGRNRRQTDGLSRLCKTCTRAKSAVNNARTTPEQHRAWREKRLADPEARARVRANAKAWAERNPEKVREQQLAASLKRKYGLSRQEYMQLLEQQAGLCAICGGSPVEGKRLVVDHNHETGEVRGLLCGPCNIMLGHSQERPDVLIKAAAYLRR